MVVGVNGVCGVTVRVHVGMEQRNAHVNVTPPHPFMEVLSVMVMPSNSRLAPNADVQVHIFRG